MNKMISTISTLTAAFTLAIGLTGCVFTGSGSLGRNDDSEVTQPDVDPTPIQNDVATVRIDPGASMATDPGYGVGVFVQYDPGGYWTVFTTCDTELSGTSCNFDVLVYADPRVSLYNVEGFDMSTSDSLILGADGSINLVTDTTYGMNGMIFDADPGALVTFDVLLDGEPAPELIYMVSDGYLLDGVPTSPVDVVPATP